MMEVAQCHEFLYVRGAPPAPLFCMRRRIVSPGYVSVCALRPAPAPPVHNTLVWLYCTGTARCSRVKEDICSPVYGAPDSSVAPNPLNNPGTPSVRSISRTQCTMPLYGTPCPTPNARRARTTSSGYVHRVCVAPAREPTVTSSSAVSCFLPGPATNVFRESLNANLAPSTGMTRSTFAPFPFHSARNPSSDTTSFNACGMLVYFGASRSALFIPWIWKMIFTRSSGAVIVLLIAPDPAPATSCSASTVLAPREGGGAVGDDMVV